MRVQYHAHGVSTSSRFRLIEAVPGTVLYCRYVQYLVRHKVLYRAIRIT
jgi:hypothetical protein